MFEEHKEAYSEYAATQRETVLPEVQISLDQLDENRTDVHMDISYKDHNYHFESMKDTDAENVQAYLNSQPLVRDKFANGKTVTFQNTQQRTAQLSARFNPKSTDGLYLYGGFVVSDADADTDAKYFLGIANLGGAETGYTEMAFLNRADAWSSTTPEIIREYAIPKQCKLEQRYQGIGTVEVCSLLQYASYLKKRGYKIKDTELTGVTATARLDNPGSWKSLAKAGMELTDIDCNLAYGPELRYQLRKRV